MALPDQGGTKTKPKPKPKPSAPGYIAPGTTRPGRPPKRNPRPRTTPVTAYDAPEREAANQSGPAPTRAAIQRAQRRKRQRERRFQSFQKATRLAQREQRRRERKAAEERLAQPYGKGIAPTASEIERTARLLSAPGMGLVATRKVAPKRSGMQENLAYVRRARQAMLSERQFNRLYGGMGDYRKYVEWVARARNVRVGDLVRVEPPELSSQRFNRLLKSERAITARVIAKLEKTITAAGRKIGVPVLIDFDGDLGALPPQTRRMLAQIVNEAAEFVGTPYVFGSAPGRTVFDADARARQLGFDCSGFVEYVYRKLGFDLTPGQQAYTGNLRYAGKQVSSAEVRPGDLVFFRSDYGHMGMYVGDGWFIHAPQTGDVVRFSRMSERDDLVEVRRMVDESGKPAGPGVRRIK